MTIYKIKAGRVPGANVDEFVADLGVIYYSEELGDLRIGDGVTPGGTSISGGGGGGGNYTLPTASTTVKGGVKVDGTTITIANQIISVANGVFSNESYSNPSWITSLAYSKLTGTPTIPTNNNQLSNGAGYITSSALSGYATETYVTTRGYLTTVSWNDVTSKPTFATVATSGSYTDLTNKPTLFSGSYNDLTNKPTLFSGAYADLTGKPTLFSGSYTDLTNKPTIPTDINQLTDVSGLLGQGGGGNYTLPTATVSTLGGVKIDGQTIQIENGQIFVGSINYSAIQNPPTLLSDFTNDVGFITGLSWSQVTGKPTFAAVATSGSYTDLSNKPTIPLAFTFNVTADDSTLRTIDREETIKFLGAGGITTTSDAEGAITITQGPAAAGTLTGNTLNSTVVTSSLTSVGTLDGLSINDTSGGNIVTISGAGRPSNGNIQTWKFYTNTNIGGPGSWIEFPDGSLQTTAWTGSVSYNNVTDTPTLFSGSYTDLTDKPTIPTNNNQLTNGAGYITSSALVGYATESYVTTRGYLTTVSWSDVTDKPNLAGTYSFYVAGDDSTQRQINSDNLIKFVGGTGITTSSDTDGNITINGFSGSYNDLTDKPTSTALNANGTLSMPQLTAEPAGKTAGQIALADGINWDPLSKGLDQPYLTIYTGTAWIEIGGITMDQVYSAILEMT